jgi:hypothetical protein
MEPRVIRLISALARKAVEDGTFSTNPMAASAREESSTGMLVSFEMLQAVTGYDRSGDITRSLREQGIRFFYGKGGMPWTTIDLINAAGDLRRGEGSSVLPYSPDLIL